MEDNSLTAMLADNDKQQALYRAKAILCDHARQTFEDCKHFKKIDKKMCTKHDASYPSEYLRFETQYTPKVTIYSKELSYNEQISFYLKANETPSWQNLIEVATKAKSDYMQYITDLEREKILYPAAIEREAKIKALQEEGEATKLSGTGQKFFPRSFCSSCRYS